MICMLQYRFWILLFQVCAGHRDYEGVGDFEFVGRGMFDISGFSESCVTGVFRGVGFPDFPGFRCVGL